MSRAPQNDCPADVLGWIPWYPDGLEADQRGAVEAHAASCAACRDEIAMLLGDNDPAEAPDPERVYAQVLARIESVAGGEEDGAPRGATVSRLPLPEPGSTRDEPDDAEPTSRGWRRIAASSSVRRVALAAGLLLALAVGALIGPPVLTPGPGEEGEPVYETASADAPRVLPEAGSDAPVLEVAFRESASAAEITKTLRALGARITSGPSQLGVYRLELGADVDLTAARALLTEDRDGVATFAEKPLRR
jgi:hypothetical protein